MMYTYSACLIYYCVLTFTVAIIAAILTMSDRCCPELTASHQSVFTLMYKITDMHAKNKPKNIKL